MLLELLRSFLGKSARHKSSGKTAARVEELLGQAQDHLAAGRIEASLTAYHAILEADPHHVVAMNQVAICLNKLRRDLEAGAYFARAALIDDSFAPALVNYAIHLNDLFQSREAERYLLMAQKIVPGDPHVDAVLGSVKMLRGRPHEACTHHLNGWLKSFDSQDFAHNHLFSGCYPSDTQAERITAEHMFWAATLAAAPAVADAVSQRPLGPRDSTARKIRIGYLSGDLRKHSVRFFFRPLLEHHDRDKFEVYAYYDMAYEDEQTHLIKARIDHFRSVANLPDAELVKTIRDDDLDILVELAGHTSITRVHLLEHRLARIQVTALGYPPTTGLSSIDYKVVDERTVPIGSEHLYTERPMRLPSSFWCFNPIEPTPDPAAAPVETNGHITFGCFGNISKISRRLLVNWARILAAVPSSRLVLKALTFQDEEAKESIREWLGSAGIDLTRVELVRPDPPEMLFAAYAGIDIILDTYPFNGGTTSCFALWMGVPIVTLQGPALISRMGASMLHTLGLTDLIADDDEAYVQAAVALANDTQRVATIRAGLRARMLETPLGNGRLYAREFEQACETALATLRIEPPRDAAAQKRRPVLGEAELLRRAGFVQQTGQLDAALRISDYCLRHYPTSAGAIITKSSVLEQKGQLQAAYDVLSSTLSEREEGQDRWGAEINLMRLDLLSGRHDNVLGRAERLRAAPLDSLGRLHVDLYAAAASAWSEQLLPSMTPQLRGALPFVSVVAHAPADEPFEKTRAVLESALAPGQFEVLRTNSSPEDRVASYAAAIAQARGDVILFVRSGVRILSPAFHHELATALDRADVVGSAGARKLAGTRWFDAGFSQAVGALVLPNSGPVGGLTLSVYGSPAERFYDGLTVLDAGLFATRRAVLEQVAFDTSLDGEHDLCELDWFARAQRSGFKLSAAPLLAVARLESVDRRGNNWFDCATRFRELHELPEPSDVPPVAGASAILPTVDAALPLLKRLYSAGDDIAV